MDLNEMKDKAAANVNAISELASEKRDRFIRSRVFHGKKGFIDQTVGVVVGLVIIITVFVLGGVLLAQMKALPVVQADNNTTAAIEQMEATYYSIPGWVGILIVVFFMVLLIGAILLLRSTRAR